MEIVRKQNDHSRAIEKNNLGKSRRSPSKVAKNGFSIMKKRKVKETLNRRNNRLTNKMIKKYQDKAHISALITFKKSFALQRLMRDYNEIKSQTVPVVGVVAYPNGDNFFEWHGNVKAIEDNIYKGAVMHLRFIFPENYPLNPPKIYVRSISFTHPNIMPEGRVCLDMLEKKRDNYKGWTSAYTVL